MIRMAFTHIKFRMKLIPQSLRNYVKNIIIDDYTIGYISEHWGQYEDSIVRYSKDVKIPSLPVELPLIMIVLDNFKNGRDIFYNIEEKILSLNINDLIINFFELYKDRKKIEKNIEEFNLYNYDMIGTHFFKTGLLTGVIFLALIKQKRLNIKTITGGPFMEMYPTLLEILQSFGVIDTFVKGAGEESLQILVNLLLDKKELPRIIETPVIFRLLPPIYAIDDLSNPNEIRFKDVGFIQGSRGCKWAKCAFCIMPNCHKYEVLPPEILSEYISYIQKKKIENFILVDSMINHSKKYVMTFYEDLIKRNIIGKIRFNKVCIRTDLIDDDMCFAFKEMNAKLYPGFESFSSRVLSLMNKGATLEDNIKCIELLIKHKIPYFPFNIIGFPGETNEDFFETLKYIKKVFSSGIFSFFKLEGGTSIYMNPEKFNISLIEFPDSLINLFPNYSNQIKSIPMRYIDLTDPDDKRFQHKRRINRLLNKNDLFWKVFSKTIIG